MAFSLVCELPVIGDPSHAAGAAGLLVEVHTDRAWSDEDQALAPAEFRALMRDLDRYAGPRLAPG